MDGIVTALNYRGHLITVLVHSNNPVRVVGEVNVGGPKTDPYGTVEDAVSRAKQIVDTYETDLAVSGPLVLEHE